jgi:hypothetical protein
MGQTFSLFDIFWPGFGQLLVSFILFKNFFISQKMSQISIQLANEEHISLAEQICEAYAESAKARGTGIAKRTPEYVTKQMREGKAIIALTEAGAFVGFCYVETWDHGHFVANSGLIVVPEYRQSGIAKAIKAKAFELSRGKFPEAKIVGITTSMAVMKINSELGYRPTAFSEMPVDDAFWKGCQSCINYEILQSKDRKMCLCTAMIYDPEEEKKNTVEQPERWNFLAQLRIFERLKAIKEKIFLKSEKRRKAERILV